MNHESIEKASQTEWSEFELREGLKSRLLEEEAINRGFETNRLSFDTVIVTMEGNALLFKDMNGPLSSAAMNDIVDNKHVARSLIKMSGVSIPESVYLKIKQKNEIIQFAQSIGYPVVLKPNNLSRGKGVFTHIDSDESLQAHLDKIQEIVGNENEKILIEKQFIGEDYRFFVVNKQVLAVTQRARGNVVGDGKKTILELINEKNMKRSEDRDLKHYLIPTEEDKLNRLYRDGMTVDSVPQKNEKIIIRDESNIASGGEGIDFTDTAYPEFKNIAVKAVQSIPGFQYAGVDIIAEDITKKPTHENYIVTEVEFSPGPLSMFPWEGIPRDMAGPILDFYSKYLDAMG